MLTIPTFRWLFPIFMLLWKIKADTRNAKVVCYYTNWSVYRPGTAKFNPQNINPYLCTHLIYAFGGFTKENNFKPFDKYQDVEKGGYAKFTGLKTYNKQLKTLLAVGGWNEGSSRFSPMVASAERRKEFVKNAVKFLRQNHFDGLDLDWEYPSFRDGGKPRDKENYALLVQGLREEFDRESEKTGREKLLLTMAVPAGIQYIKKGYDLEKLNKYLDWMNILSYDYHSAFEPSVNHHAPLYPLEEESEYNFDSDLNVHHTIQFYLENGVDKDKLVMGIPTYGRSYTLYNPEANELGAPADGPGDMGDATRENGYLAYYEICEKIKSDGWEVVEPNSDAMGPYALKDNQWVGYDDENIVRKKAEYVAENGLGGIMFWSIDNDDFRGHCNGKSYPLIEAAKEALIAATSNAISNSKPAKGKTTHRIRKPSKPSEEKEERIQNSGGRQSIESTSDRRRVNSIRQRTREEEKESRGVIKKRRSDNFDDDGANSRRKIKGRRRPTTATSITSTTPAYYTPEPPTTPDSGSDFKCEDEGFYPHPRDCKKYFWCLSSGPSELGIVAHQFTCPSGLYFNKAADSCDYTQNVFCNKKKAKSSSTTTESTTSSTTAYTTVRRFTTTTTTAPPEYEYEYEDDIILDKGDERGSKHAEEDPRVLKELIELIKKAGGIEELEKQLKFEEDGTASIKTSDSTTPSTISKTLYERVLSRKTEKPEENKNTLTYKLINRNSRGPQNEGIKKDDVSELSYSKSTPKYTIIQRNRPSTEKTLNEEVPLEEDEEEYEDEEEEPERVQTEAPLTRNSYTRVSHPEYVTIKRTRPTTETTPSKITEEAISKSSARGAIESTANFISVTPGYATVSRQRPLESSTLQYVTIRGRSTTIQKEEEESTISSKTESSDESFRNDDAKSTQNTVTTVSDSRNAIEDVNSINDRETTTKTIQSSSEKIGEKPSPENIPELSEPTPFLRRSRPTTVSTTTTTTTTTPKVSPIISSNRLRKRPLKIPSPRPVVESSNEKVAASLNALESSNEKLDKEITKPSQRRRGGSRFRLQTSESVAAQKSSPNQVDVSDRHFRPNIEAELSDLSTLTAADIDLTKDVRQFHRRRRPTTSSTSTTIKTTAATPIRREFNFRRLNIRNKEKESRGDISEETAASDKLTQTETFIPSKRRRIVIRNNEDTSDSSVSTSNTSVNRKPLDNKESNGENDQSNRFLTRKRVFSRRTTAEPKSLDLEEEVKISAISTTANTNEEDVLSKKPEDLEDSSKKPDQTLSTVEIPTNKRRRKVIRILKHRITTTPLANSTEKTVPVSSNISMSTENNLPLENAEFSKDSNITSNDTKKSSDNKEEVMGISDEEEDENIKLSETIISESKNTEFNRNDFFGADEKNIDSFGKGESRKGISKDSDENTQTTTETSQIYQRRNKVTRFYSTNQPTLSTTAVSVSNDTFGQRTQPKKTIRRLRPSAPRFEVTSEKAPVVNLDNTSRKYFRRPNQFLRNKQFGYSLEYLNRPSSTEATTKTDLSKRYYRRKRPTTTTTTEWNDFFENDEVYPTIKSFSIDDIFSIPLTNDYATTTETDISTTEENEDISSTTLENKESSTLDDSTTSKDYWSTTMDGSTLKLVDESVTTTELPSSVFTTEYMATTDGQQEFTESSTSSFPEITSESAGLSEATTATTSTTSTTTPTSGPKGRRLFVPSSLRSKLRLTQKSNSVILKNPKQDDENSNSSRRPQFEIYNSRYGAGRNPVVLNQPKSNEDEDASNNGREENDIEEEYKVNEYDSNVSKEIEDDVVPKDLKLTTTKPPLRSGFRPSLIRRPPAGFKLRSTSTTTETPSTTAVNVSKALDARNKFFNTNSRKYKNPVLKHSNESSTVSSPTTIGTTNVIENNETTTAVYHHVFEQNENVRNPVGGTDFNSTKTLEKLIEVNRIVKVSLKEATNDDPNAKEVTLLPSIDKVGVISRLKTVNVVDGSRNSKLNFDPNLYPAGATDSHQPNEIHIDSKSMVHTFTAKPTVNLESATISLEGLFHYSPFKESDKLFENDESLETDNSHKVSVRIIQPIPPVNRVEKKIESYDFAHPMNIIHENGAVRAKVVEIKPDSMSDFIKIAPIAVSLGEKVSSQSTSETTVQNLIANKDKNVTVT